MPRETELAERRKWKLRGHWFLAIISTLAAAAKIGSFLTVSNMTARGQFDLFGAVVLSAMWSAMLWRELQSSGLKNG